MRPVMAAWRGGTRATAHRVDRYVANSQYVARRIARYYNRSAAVVYPPVDTDFYCPDAQAPPATGCWWCPRWSRTSGSTWPSRPVPAPAVPLTVVGQGPEVERLRRTRAGPTSPGCGSGTDEEIRRCTGKRRAVLLPGVEDFGIVPVEAQACGRPVVALARGGALETVVDGVTGVLVSEASAEAFADGDSPGAWTGRSTRGAIRRHAERFGRARFAAADRAAVEATAGRPRGRGAMVRRYNRLLAAFHVVVGRGAGGGRRSCWPT